MDHLLSERITQLEESQTLEMARKARDLEASGKKIIKLSLGEPDFNTPDYIKEAAKKAIDHNFTFYTPVPGFLDLRKAIAHKLNRDNRLDVTAEQIVVSTGAKQSLYNIMMALINPGDEVVVFTPYWVSYIAMIELAGGKVKKLEASIDNNYKITTEQLEKAIGPNTKAILFSSPSNPTGSVYSEKELRAIAAIVAQHPDLYIISDEIYEYIIFDEKHFSIGSIDAVKDSTITVNGFSKGFAMTGWRIGYIAAPVPIAQACTKMQGQVTSGTCSITQKAAEIAISSPLDEVYKMKEQYHKRRDLLLKLMQELKGFKSYVPEGAFYLFPDVSFYFGTKYDGKRIQDSDDLCMYLLEDAGVALVGGNAFGAPNSLRISFAASEQDLIDAVKKMEKSLKKLTV